MSELPSANAMAHVRTRPVMRDTSVATDMSAVDFATAECVSSETSATHASPTLYHSKTRLCNYISVTGCWTISKERAGKNAMNIIIVANRNNPTTIDAMYQIIAYLDAQGISHVEIDVSDLPDSAFACSSHADEARVRYGGNYDLIITLGGDGTILHTARLANVIQAPVLGINFGHLGFLANTVDGGAISLIADALAGEIMHEQRVNLQIEVVCEGDAEEPPDEPRMFFALNEIAIARGAMGHIVDFSYSVSGDLIATMRGDGVIVSTATGSTAYSLSAGGPLICPSHRGIIVTPLVPHTLNSRAIVTEHHDVVEVMFEEGSPSAREVSLFVDGDALALERPISSIIVTTGPDTTTLLIRREESFYKQVSRTFFR